MIRPDQEVEMYEVAVVLGGAVRATAESETPEGIVLAAKTLIRDDLDALGYPRLRDYRANFSHGGAFMYSADYETVEGSCR